jgi:hypothetical protein
MVLSDLLTRDSGWSSFGQERKVNVWSMSSGGRIISVARLFMATVMVHPLRLGLGSGRDMKKHD